MLPKGSNRSKPNPPKIFDAQNFLDSAGVTRKVTEFKSKQPIFSQGDPCNNVLYIQKGGVRLSVVNQTGKEAVVAVLGPGDFWVRDASPVSRFGWVLPLRFHPRLHL
jgi:CRP-like cAMP-binding protein